MTDINLNHFLILSLLLFTIGLLGLINRKNMLVLLMSIEIMLNAVNLSLVAFSQFYSLLSGQIVAFFVMTISAAEAGIGLALIIVLSRRLKTTDLISLESLKE